MRKSALVVTGAILFVLGMPAVANADHDCGPPPKHSDHQFGPEDRKKPCK